MKKSKKLSNPFSTGSGGAFFEAHIQALYVTLMLTGGYAPLLPCWPITEVKLQGKIDGCDTDDLIVFVEDPLTGEKRKMLSQIKHSIQITDSDKELPSVIQAAWNDYINHDLFTADKDKIALITGPISKTDFRNVQWLLDQAKCTKDVEEFNRHVKTANFSPPKSIEKLEVIRRQLQLANNTDLSDEVLYNFLKHYYLLGYDLGNDGGVIKPLMYSHISQYNKQIPDRLWSNIVEFVQSWNKNAGTITMENLPSEFRELFKQPIINRIPMELVVVQQESVKTDWNQLSQATELALINIIGSWNEKNEEDTKVISDLVGESYSTFVHKAREILQLSDSPLSLNNGVWRIEERSQIWDALGSRIIGRDLEILKDIAIAVLTEQDPAFDLPPNQRIAASLYGKVLSHSENLRTGLAQSLALAGNNNSALIHCHDRAESIARQSIREVFSNADWKLWGTLNYQLPILSEAAPDEFLNAVEIALHSDPCPFDELFSLEDAGIFGCNYLTGLLWALEGLAWDKEYLVQVCIILGELNRHDIGGNWANRPMNSLTTILLPWHPQTTAPIEKRKVAVQTLLSEFPETGWNLLISLLPNQHQSTMGSHRPSWRNTIPNDWTDSVTNADYWDQVTLYSELAISSAKHNPDKLTELIDNLTDLPNSALYHLLDVLSSDAILRLPEDEQVILWNKLSIFIAKQKRYSRYSDANRVLSDEQLALIEKIREKLTPSNLFYLHEHLFSEREFDLYEDIDDLEEQKRTLRERQKSALRELIDTNGIENVIEFSQIVDSSYKVGYILGGISKEEFNKILFPSYLDMKGRKLSQFISGYINGCYDTYGWQWADAIDRSIWSNEQIANLLCSLPFCSETWSRASKWLGDSERNYWQKTNVNAYESKNDLDPAIEKLITFERPNAAISCLHALHSQSQPIKSSQCVIALLAALSTSEPPYTVTPYEITDIIITLQKAPDIPLEDLIKVEWAYLPLLSRIGGSEPKTLEYQLANKPEFFCEVIQLLYRSKKDNSPTTSKSEHAEAIATNAWRLLHEWHIIPGTLEDGTFSASAFESWFEHVKEICTKSGHLEVALVTLGEVLIHAPADVNGLWINQTLAKVINEFDADKIREGFEIGKCNERGVVSIDPTGKPERILSEQYNEMANALESAGYHRFAISLRNLSKTYDHQARGIIEKSKTQYIQD